MASAPSPRPPRGPLRVLWELPLWGGVAAGLIMTWLRGELFVLNQEVSGYTWNNWLHNAWYVAHGRWALLDGFRKPLHGFLVGHLGEQIGYADAGILVASASVTLLLLSAGLLGRVLGGPAAGGLAAFALGASPLIQNAAHWGTAYPLLAAGTSLSLAMAVRYAVRPRPAGLIAVGLACVLVLATDDRGLLVLGVVLGLVAVGVHRQRKQRWLALGVAAAIAIMPTRIDRALGLRPPVALPMMEKRGIQKAVVQRWLRIEPDPLLVSTCRGIQRDEPLEPAFFTTPCARQVLRRNSAILGPRASIFSASWLTFGALAWLVGGRRPGRAATWTAGALGAATWLFFASATPMPHRYILQFAAPIALVIPVAAGRLMGVLASGWRGWTLQLLVCGALALGAWDADVHHRDSKTQRERGNWSKDSWAVEAALVDKVVPKDAHFLDCSGHAIHSALLPDYLFLQAPVLNPAADFCRQWITDPSWIKRRRWLGVRPGYRLRDRDTREEMRVDQLVSGQPGWERIFEFPDFELWLYRGPSDPQ